MGGQTWPNGSRINSAKRAKNWTQQDITNILLLCRRNETDQRSWNHLEVSVKVMIAKLSEYGARKWQMEYWKWREHLL